jgi:hypothetical protein
MTDRELLELAAKAAGLDVSFDATQWDRFWVNGGGGFWNPLTDDGDALRLAVKLSLHISVFVDAIGVGTPGAGYDELKYEGDPLAATRRAIVRAAAALRGEG